MILILLIVLAATLAYWKLSKHYKYWTERGVKQKKGLFLLGGNKEGIFKKESMFDLVCNMYKTFPDERYMGVYQVTLPTLLIRDPDLIKLVTVKDFDHFLNHRAFVPDGVEPLWDKNLISLNDIKWKEMRSTLSPSFTSSRMKIMFTLISECADEFMNHLLKDGKSHTLEMKDTFSRYTNDVIASVAFGIKCNSIEDRNNEFYTMGRKAMNFNILMNIKVMFYMFAPKLSQLLRLRFFSPDVTNFFTKVIKEAIDMRESQNIVRPDMLNLLLEARKGKKLVDTDDVPNTGFATVEESPAVTDVKPAKQTLTDLDITAQGMIFFLAGFETVATLMSFAAYELVLNPEIQKKLQQEIDDTLEECGGKLTYDALMKMKYMDMVVSETLRMWPSAVVTDRMCSKPYTIKPTQSHETEINLEPGDLIWIPICALHRDEKYYPNPDKFDPERFSDENKANIRPYTYLPFGVGPRNCIGSRFALMETKAILFYMLSKFDLLVCDKTDVPIKLKKIMFQFITENGVWMELKPRNK